MNAIILLVSGILSQVLLFKYVIMKRVRIQQRHFQVLYKIAKSNKGLKFVINEEFNSDQQGALPAVYQGFFKLKGMFPFWMNMDERQNNTGYTSVTPICDVWIFRWDNNRLKELFTSKTVKCISEHVHVYVNDRWLGELITDENIEIDSQYEEIEKDFIRIADGEINKTSFILYGGPGNGKTSLIRNLAVKYGWNLQFFDINTDTVNVDIISLPSRSPDKTIILMEDFDTLFDKRTVLKYGADKVRFSFDAILNMMDGVYQNKGKVIYAMTANDVSKIDPAILDRPSRIKHKIEVTNPSSVAILRIVRDYEISQALEGSNLDYVYYIADFLKLNGKEKTLEKIKLMNKVVV